MQKYGFDDARPVLERASARETAARVALGAVAQALPRAGVGARRCSATSSRIGAAVAPDGVLPGAGRRRAGSTPTRSAASTRRPARRWSPRSTRPRRDGDTLGGVVEVLAYGLPPGLGSHVHWDRRLDSRLAGGADGHPGHQGRRGRRRLRSRARRRGSQAHDEIERDDDGGCAGAPARAGGTEGGMTTGEPLRVRAAMKPISTVPRALGTVDVAHRRAGQGDQPAHRRLRGARRRRRGRGDGRARARRRRRWRSSAATRSPRRAATSRAYLDSRWRSGDAPRRRPRRVRPASGKTHRRAAASPSGSASPFARHRRRRRGGRRQPIADIFVDDGEEHFRALERAAVAAALAEHDGVLALGGGAVLDAGTRDAAGRPHRRLPRRRHHDAAQRVGLNRDRPLLLGNPRAQLDPADGGAAAALRGGRDASRSTPTAGRPTRSPTRSSRWRSAGERRRRGSRSRGEPPYDVVVGARRAGRAAPPSSARRAAQVARGAPARRWPTSRAGSRRHLRRRPASRSCWREVPGRRGGQDRRGRRACWVALGRPAFTRTDAGRRRSAAARPPTWPASSPPTWLRGVRVVHVPTTLLGMVDAAVGGKTGVNTAEGKNLVGAFHPPAGVLCDLDDPGHAAARRPRRAGWPRSSRRASSPTRASSTSSRPTPRPRSTPAGPALRELVERAIAGQGRRGRRRGPARAAAGREVLNYGHTLGHAIEKVEDYRWRHGDAVSVGLVFAAELARAGRAARRRRRSPGTAACWSRWACRRRYAAAAGRSCSPRCGSTRRPAATGCGSSCSTGSAGPAASTARTTTCWPRVYEEVAAVTHVCWCSTAPTWAGSAPRAGRLRHATLRRPGRRLHRGRRTSSGWTSRSARPTTRASWWAGCTRPPTTATPVVLNPAAFTHYSYALRDACARSHRPAGRGAPDQPGGPRGVPAHLGGRRRRHRHDHRLRPDSYRLALRAVAAPLTRVRTGSLADRARQPSRSGGPSDTASAGASPAAAGASRTIVRGHGSGCTDLARGRGGRRRHRRCGVRDAAPGPTTAGQPGPGLCHLVDGVRAAGRSGARALGGALLDATLRARHDRRALPTDPALDARAQRARRSGSTARRGFRRRGTDQGPRRRQAASIGVSSRDRLGVAPVPETHADRATGCATWSGRAGAEAALVTRLVNVRYLHRVHRLQRRAARHGRRRAVLRHRRPLRDAGAAQSRPDLELLIDRECAAGLVGRAGRRRPAAGSRSRRTTSPSRRTPALPQRRTARRSWSPLGHAGRGRCARSRTRARSRCCARRARSATGRCDETARPASRPGRTEREVARAPGGRHARPRRRRRRVRDDRRHRPEQRDPAPPPDRPRDRRAATCSRSTSARCTAATTPTAPARSWSGAEPADWQREIYDLVAAAQRAGRHALAVGADVRDVDAAARGRGRRRGLRRRSSPTASATASAWRSTRLRCWAPTRPVDSLTARRSPSSPGSTSPAAAGSASRTPWSSATGAPELLTHDDQGPAGPLDRPDRRRRRTSRVATTNDLKNGLVLNLDGQLWTVVEFQHVKPGKGGAFVRTKLKNVLSGKVVDKTFNAGTKVETATVDKRDMQYLYNEGDRLRLHGHRSPTTRSTSRPTTVGDAAELPAREPGRRGRAARGHAALRRAARLGRADDLLHRARHAGRPVHRRHQAGHAWRPAPRSPSRCSSPPARRSRSTPATAATSAGSPV